MYIYIYLYIYKRDSIDSLIDSIVCLSCTWDADTTIPTCWGWRFYRLKLVAHCSNKIVSDNYCIKLFLSNAVITCSKAKLRCFNDLYGPFSSHRNSANWISHLHFGQVLATNQIHLKKGPLAMCSVETALSTGWTWTGTPQFGRHCSSTSYQ